MGSGAVGTRAGGGAGVSTAGRQVGPQEGGEDGDRLHIGCSGPRLSLPGWSGLPASPHPSPPHFSKGNTTLEAAGLCLPLCLPLSQPPGPWLPRLQGEPRVISVLFRAGRLPLSQLVGLQAARSRRGATRGPPPAPRWTWTSGRCAGAPWAAPGLVTCLPTLGQPPSAPSALITATHVQPTAPLPSSNTSPFSFSLPQAYSPGPGVYSCKENTHTLMHKTNCGMFSCF